MARIDIINQVELRPYSNNFDMPAYFAVAETAMGGVNLWNSQGHLPNFPLIRARVND